MIKLMLTVTITRNLRTINYKMKDRTIGIISLIVIFGVYEPIRDAMQILENVKIMDETSNFNFDWLYFKNYYKADLNSILYKLMANPVAKFIDHYILHLGFLDGKAGYSISKISAYATYLKYKKLKDLNDNKKRSGGRNSTLMDIHLKEQKG